MTSRQAQLPMRDELSVQALMAIPLGTWFSNQHRAFRLVRRWPASNELTLEGPLGEFRTTPDHILRSGYRAVKRKPKHAVEGS